MGNNDQTKPQQNTKQCDAYAYFLGCIIHYNEQTKL